MGIRIVFSGLALLLVSKGSCQQNQNSGGSDLSKENKTEVALPGVDTSALTPRERREWGGYVSRFAPPCANAGATIASCVQEKKDCGMCIPAAKFVVKAVRDGMTDEQIENAYKNRFDASKVKEVKFDDSPSKGPETAPVTIVEFADFECPHCGMVAPMLGRVFKNHSAHVRVIYKFMPLPGHPNGEIAARAGISANKQNRFWDMHDKMFSNQGKNGQLDLEGYAKELGLDPTKFKNELQSPETTDRITRDKKLADSLDVKGTPTIFINGRLFDAGANPEQALEDWVKLELIGKGIDPGSATTAATTPAPTGSVSAKATATASAKAALPKPSAAKQ